MSRGLIKNSDTEMKELLEGPQKLAMMKPKKIQVLLDAPAQAKLEELQQAYGFTVADIIREAVGFFYWMHLKAKLGFDFGLILGGKIDSVIALPFQWRGRPNM